MNLSEISWESAKVPTTPLIPMAPTKGYKYFYPLLCRKRLRFLCKQLLLEVAYNIMQNLGNFCIHYELQPSIFMIKCIFEDGFNWFYEFSFLDLIINICRKSIDLFINLNSIDEKIWNMTDLQDGDCRTNGRWTKV